MSDQDLYRFVPPTEEETYRLEVGKLLPRPLPVATFYTGLALVLALLFDLAMQMPPQPENLLWQISYLEDFFNKAGLLAIGVLLMLSGVWMSDAIRDAKSRGKNSALGSFSLLVGMSLLLCIPLHCANISHLHSIKSAQLLAERKEVNPFSGSVQEDEFEAAQKILNESLFKRLFRSASSGATMGCSLILLSILALRQVRERTDIGFCCPSCLGLDITPTPVLSKTEESLAFYTRIQPFVCEYCDTRFHKFSLTGKPFALF